MKSLFETCKEKIVIAAHRGTSGGNIPCNTMPAYRLAYRQGADMLEIDLNRTADGHLVIFHPKMERNHLGFIGSIRDYTFEQIQNVLRYVNYDRTPTEFSLCTFDEVLEEFKGKCFINVDKFWDYPAEIARAIRAHGMTEQIVVKTAPKPDVFRVLEEVAPEIMFMAIYDKTDGGYHEILKKSKLNYIGAELLFDSEDCEIARPEYIGMLHSEGRIAWVNAIVYNYRRQLAARHSDDTSLIDNPDRGWGWLADRGFDIIQTDWTLPMREYLEKTGKLYR